MERPLLSNASSFHKKTNKKISILKYHTNSFIQPLISLISSRQKSL